MPAQNDALKDRLSRYREINIIVTGRKSGRTISIPVFGGRQALPSAGAGVRYTMVQERPQETVHSDRCAWGRG